MSNIVSSELSRVTRTLLQELHVAVLNEMFQGRKHCKHNRNSISLTSQVKKKVTLMFV